METYSLLRTFADSWMLLALFLFFIGMVLWLFRPGNRERHADSAMVPFRHELAPAGDAAESVNAADNQEGRA